MVQYLIGEGTRVHDNNGDEDMWLEIHWSLLGLEEVQGRVC